MRSIFSINPTINNSTQGSSRCKIEHQIVDDSKDENGEEDVDLTSFASKPHSKKSETNLNTSYQHLDILPVRPTREEEAYLPEVAMQQNIFDDDHLDAEGGNDDETQSESNPLSSVSPGGDGGSSAMVIIRNRRRRNSGFDSQKQRQCPRGYIMHRYLLYFLDPEVEQRYFNFQYVDNAFVPGKIFALMWISALCMSFILFTQPLTDNASYTVESFTSPWWFGSYVSTAICSVLFVGLFIDKLRPYREIMHLLQIILGWPTVVLEILVLKRPAIFRYGCLDGAVVFCVLITQCRLCRSLPIVTFWPLLCLFVVTFSVPDYWEEHTKVEMLYWVIIMAPVVLLFFLEKQTRRSFVGKELALLTISEIKHRTLVTQRMIANFFPPTPTRDLLLPPRSSDGSGSRGKEYRDVVIVLTDVEGFTAYTSKSTPSDVLRMLTHMYQHIEEAAKIYTVEKIATVGDSYCGAIFSKDLEVESAVYRVSTPVRCKRGIMFACATLSSVGQAGLQLRVGAHIGDTIGMFVGCAPPKFDLFGAGIDHVRLLEEEGQPGAVHISQAFLEATNIPPSKIDLSLLRQTARGLICVNWTDILALYDIDDPLLDHSQNFRSLEASGSLNSKVIVSALCGVAHIRSPPIQSTDNEEEEDKSTTITTKTSPTSLNEVGEKMVELDPFEFSKFVLRFKKPSIEKRFQTHMKSNGINYFCARVFVVQAFALLIIQHNLMCGSSRDLAITSTQIGILTCMSLYIYITRTNTKYHIGISFVVYNLIQIILFLGLTSDCEGLKLRAEYISDVACCFQGIALFAPQYCIDVKLVYRAALTIATCVIMAMCMIIRGQTIGDGAVAIDPMPIYGGVVAIMSYFPEYVLRTAFQSKLRLDQLQRSATTRSAAMSTSALSIMLPTFVTEKIVSLALEAKLEAARNPLILLPPSLATSATRTTMIPPPTPASTDFAATMMVPDFTTTIIGVGASVDAADEVDFSRLTATWEYNHVVVMFVSFTSTDASFTPDVIHLTFQAIEKILHQFKVMKVKTIGSTIMLVAGVGDPRTRQDQLSGMIDVAISIRSTIFQLLDVPLLRYRFGVHCGPCFGAIMGGNGAIFDLVGDMVNLSSRMMTTAEDKAIQLSPAAHHLLLPHLKNLAKLRSAVAVKGKGIMAVFVLREEVGVDQIPTYSSTIAEYLPQDQSRRSIRAINRGAGQNSSTCVDAWGSTYSINCN